MDIVIDTLVDTLKLVPFLFVAFLLIELFEHKLKKYATAIFSHKANSIIAGSLLGSIPQCGFSVLATNLYITRIISLGSLIAIYLSTSDEMIPVMISENVPFNTIGKILLIKVLIGILCGFIIDLILRKKEESNFNICEECHHHCESSIIKSSLIHTLKISLVILIITFILNTILEFTPEDLLTNLLKKNNILTPFLSSLVGLIPNCAASVMITELYINGFLSFGSMIAGLLTGSGTSLIVLFKSNKKLLENIMIVFILYVIGVISGIIINLVI